MAQERLVDQLTIPVLGELFDVGADAPPRLVVEAAARVRATVPQLVLSVAHRAGHTLGSGSRDVLQRAATRAADYRDLVAMIRREVPGVRVIKGAAIGRLYPDDLLRPVGDVDLCVATAQEVWQVAAAIARARPLRDVGLVLHGGDLPLPFVTMLWDPADTLLDRPMKAEVFCTPFMGNAAAIGVRMPQVDRDGFLFDLLALCEERFQRPYNPKDIADVLVLAEAPMPDAAQIAAAAAAASLAPELADLLAYAAGCADIGPLHEVRALLDAPAKEELERRDAWVRPPIDKSAGSAVVRWLRYGVPVPSVVLRRRELPGESPDTEVEPFGRHLIYRTPIADFLVTVDEVVSRADADAALRRLDQLDRTGTDPVPG